jgi:hypothetical protein
LPIVDGARVCAIFLLLIFIFGTLFQLGFW